MGRAPEDRHSQHGANCGGNTAHLLRGLCDPAFREQVRLKHRQLISARDRDTLFGWTLCSVPSRLGSAAVCRGRRGKEHPPPHPSKKESGEKQDCRQGTLLPGPMSSGLFGSYMVRPPNALCTSHLAKQLGALEENLVFLPHLPLAEDALQGGSRHEF